MTWVLPPMVLTAGGPRSMLLIGQAYFEEGLQCPSLDERVAPIKLLYPRSFVDRISAMDRTKTHDYCFIGGLYRPETFPHRRWILEFARRRFSDRSYFLLTDGREQHDALGDFDYTHAVDDIRVPKMMAPAERAFFHDHYFKVMSASEFTVCPAGDAPWSMRFFEAIMCRSIPIVSDLSHTGRNELERSIGYRVLLADDVHEYDKDLAEQNFRTFLRHQTLIETPRN